MKAVKDYSKGSDLDIRGAPSVQGLILRVQDLRKRSDLENQGAPSVQGSARVSRVLILISAAPPSMQI